MRKYGESKKTQIMMATVPHASSGLGLRKFQADGFLLTRLYKSDRVNVVYNLQRNKLMYKTYEVTNRCPKPIATATIKGTRKRGRSRKR